MVGEGAGCNCSHQSQNALLKISETKQPDVKGDIEKDEMLQEHKH